jgi:hypothetical protein
MRLVQIEILCLDSNKMRVIRVERFYQIFFNEARSKILAKEIEPNSNTQSIIGTEHAHSIVEIGAH